MENQLLQDSNVIQTEPHNASDNSAPSELQQNTAQSLKEIEGKSNDSSNLILGKFKTADDLSEAYKQLEKLQGNQSSELGMLREKVASMNANNATFKALESIYANRKEIQETAKKYSEYFSDPSFKQIYFEAFKAFGTDLDVDRLVNLVESYASSRIFAYEKSKSANAETQQAISGMRFDKNDKTVNTPVRKSIQQMSPKELDEMLDKLI